MTGIVLFFFAITVTALWFTRRYWLAFNCAGAYVVSFLVVNFVGIYTITLGFEFSTLELYVTEEDRILGFVVAHVGLLSALSGLFLAGLFLGPPRTRPSLPRSLPLGFNVAILYPLTLVVLLPFGYYLKTHLGLLQAAIGSALDLYAYRSDAYLEIPYLMIQICYNVLPYLGLCYFAMYLKDRSHLLALGVFLAACLGTFILLHKQPLILYLFQAAACYMFINPKRFNQVSGMSVKLFFGGIAAAALILAVLIALFTVTHEQGDASFTEHLMNSTDMANERIVGRNALGYFLVAKYVPQAIPHYGFYNIATLARVLGAEPIEVNRLIFVYEHPEFENNGIVGTISSDAITNYYGGFGLLGLVFFGLLHGVFLASIDRVLELQRPTMNSLICLLFMMKCSFYLNETTVFGALLGFGGIVYLGLGWMLQCGPQDGEPQPANSLRLERSTGGQHV